MAILSADLIAQAKYAAAAIVLVMLLFGALFQFGVLAPRSVTRCTLPAGFGCTMQLATDGSNALNLSQGIGAAIRITAIRCTQEATVTFNAADGVSPPRAVANASSAVINGTCLRESSGGTVPAAGMPGDVYSGRIHIQYEYANGSQVNITGEVVLPYGAPPHS